MLVPAAFLVSCQIKEQVDMQLTDGQIVIKNVRRKLRDGWFVDAAAPSNAVLAKALVKAEDWSDVPRCR